MEGVEAALNYHIQDSHNPNLPFHYLGALTSSKLSTLMRDMGIKKKAQGE